MVLERSWQERYEHLVEENLTAEDAKVLLSLLQENPELLAEMLVAFVDTSEDELEGNERDA